MSKCGFKCEPIPVERVFFSNLQNPDLATPELDKRYFLSNTTTFGRIGWCDPRSLVPELCSSFRPPRIRRETTRLCFSRHLRTALTNAETMHDLVITSYTDH